jgi:hypothetical protein
MLLEQIGAAIVLAVCLGIWAHMLLTPERRQRLLTGPRRLLRGWRRRRSARREAAQAIARARGKPKVDREGNVYRPKSFDRTRDDDETLH